jgi:hypothetical protein
LEELHKSVQVRSHHQIANDTKRRAQRVPTKKPSKKRLSQPYLGNKTHAITYKEFGKMIEMIVCQTDDNKI